MLYRGAVLCRAADSAPIPAAAADAAATAAAKSTISHRSRRGLGEGGFFCDREGANRGTLRRRGTVGGLAGTSSTRVPPTGSW